MSGLNFPNNLAKNNVCHILQVSLQYFKVVVALVVKLGSY